MSTMTSTSPSSSFYIESVIPPSSPSHTSSSSTTQPSARFLYNQAAHLFLLRQHFSTLDLLDALFRQLPRPKQAWTSGSGREGKEKDRDEVRRKAVLLWITCRACVFTDRARSRSASEGEDARGKERADGSQGESAEDLYRFLVNRSSELCSPSLPSFSSRPPSTLPPLPPTIAHTLILTSLKLGLLSSHPYNLVVLPFLTSLPPALTSLLAAQSRKRETREGSLDRTRGNEGWAGDMLDGYEKVLESWCVNVLGQSEGKVREATEIIGLDGVLGRSKKEELLQTLQHLPPLTPSPPANISLLPLFNNSSASSSTILASPPPRPASPTLSDASETTATPNNFRLDARGRKGKWRETRRATEDGEPSSSDVILEESMWNYSAFVDRVRRFVAPRPPRPSSSDEDTSRPLSSPSRVGHPFLFAIRTHLGNLQLPASVLLMFVLAVVGVRRWWVSRRVRVALGGPAGGGGMARDRANLALIGAKLRQAAGVRASFNGRRSSLLPLLQPLTTPDTTLSPQGDYWTWIESFTLALSQQGRLCTLLLEGMREDRRTPLSSRADLELSFLFPDPPLPSVPLLVLKMFALSYTVVILAVLVSLQQATTYLVPLSTLLLLSPLALVLVLLSSLPLTILLGRLADRSATPLAERQTHLEQAFRPLGFSTPAAWSVVQLRQAWETSPPLPPSPAASPSPFARPPPVSTKLPLHRSTPYFLLQPIDTLFNRIIDDFVLSWYSKISPSPTFPNELETTIRHSLASILFRIESTDLPSLVVSKIIPQVTNHLLSFSNAEHSLRLAHGGRLHASSAEGLDLFLSQAYGPNTLHPAVAGNTLDTKPAQEAHVRGLVEGILKLVLPEKERRSRAVLIVAREIVTSAVLMPVVEMLSDPDFWNRMLDEQASNYIREQNLVHQLREALDLSLPVPSSSSSTQPPVDPRSARSSKQGISVKTDTKSFESFVKGIGKVDSLMDLRRLRSDLGGEIRKTKGSLDSIHAGVPLTSGEKAEDLRGHLERLYLARAKAERRISHLSGDGAPSNESSRISSSVNTTTAKVDLHSVLINPSSLSYFMEFMERKNKILLVQFWLTIESFKDPLEDVDAEVSDEWVGADEREDEIAATAREDMRGVWEVYFEDGILGEDVGERFGEDIRRFLGGSGSSGMAKARKSMFLAQRQIYKQMEDDFFPPFRTSDLYFKAAAHVAATTSAPPPLAPSIPHPPSFPHRQTASPLVHILASSSPSHPSAPKFPRSPLAPPPEGRTLPRLSSPVVDPSSNDRKALPAVTSEHSAHPPHFHRAQTWTAQPTISLVKADLDGSSHLSASTSASRATFRSPPVSSQLDFLMGGSDTGDSPTRAPLFEESAESHGLGIALDLTDQENDSEDEDYIQVRRLDAIQAALTSIIAKDQSSRPSSPQMGGVGGRAQDASGTSRRVASQTSISHSIDSLPLFDASSPDSRRLDRGQSHSPSAPSRPSMSASNPELIPRRSKVFDDAIDSPGSSRNPAATASDSEDVDPQGKVQLAAPGDLQLPTEIARLGAKLDKLQSQEPILDALIRKAELTGSEDELQILSKSHSGLLREIRALSFQKSQYEQQELENRLDPRRTKIGIPSSTSVDEDGKQVVRYLVEVQQTAPDGTFAHGWVVARRYNEFFSLHHDLRETVPATRHLVLPGKMLVTSMSSSFVDSRRSALEKYLQSLLSIEVACNSPHLRAFLSQHTSQSVDVAAEENASRKGPSFLPQNLVKSIYRTVATGLDDSLFAGPSMLDLIGQRLTRQAGEFATLAGLASAETSSSAQPRLPSSKSTTVPDLLDLPPELKPLEGETASSYFTAPICDLFVEVFELKENNWLRRQAIVIILQQILGGAIERKLRDIASSLISPPSILKYLNSFSNTLWPGGVKREPSVPRTEEQKRRTKADANKKLASLMPDVASNMIGRSNARQGARRLFSVLQNPRLNQHLVHTIVDEVVYALFPELVPKL